MRPSRCRAPHAARPPQVCLDRATGQVVEDATDEPWERFVAHMREAHGYRSRVVVAAPQEAAAGAGSFVCAFERCDDSGAA